MMNKDAPGLDKRKAFILATVIYEYIATAEPVGSNSLIQKYNLGVSSATIRNEMADLEAAGYLVQPHTSAGRIPSDAGYREYVDHLMKPEPLSGDDQRRIHDEFRRASKELDGIIDHTTRLLGSLSKNVALVVAPGRDEQTFRHIQLIWLAPRSGVAVIVTSMGVAAQSMFELRNDVNADDFTRLSNLLNSRFGGKLFREVKNNEVQAAAKELHLGEDVCKAVVAAFESARSSSEPAVFSSGTQNLLDQPEFHDLRNLRSILRIVEEQKSLYDLVADSMNEDKANVRIGHELGSDDMLECSLVTVPYTFGNRAVGMLAILGPRRMPYGRLLSLAAGTAENLSKHLAQNEIK